MRHEHLHHFLPRETHLGVVRRQNLPAENSRRPAVNLRNRNRRLSPRNSIRQFANLKRERRFRIGLLVTEQLRGDALEKIAEFQDDLVLRAQLDGCAGRRILLHGQLEFRGSAIRTVGAAVSAGASALRADAGSGRVSAEDSGFTSGAVPGVFSSDAFRLKRSRKDMNRRYFENISTF